MFDKVRIGSLLDRIENSILLIQSKSGEINCPDDFLLSQDGMFILSGICMQLVFIGESVKTIDNKTNHSYLIKYTDIPWTAIMGLRGSPDKPGGLSIQLCKSEKKEFYIRYSS